jgi:hypothetical protein
LRKPHVVGRANAVVAGQTAVGAAAAACEQQHEEKTHTRHGESKKTGVKIETRDV